MKKKQPYESPETEELEFLLEAAFASPQPNQPYEEDDDEFHF